MRRTVRLRGRDGARAAGPTRRRVLGQAVFASLALMAFLPTPWRARTRGGWILRGDDR
jgi:hypothetical protein